ncbi:MAG: dihydroneopterin aldolase [Drouetiella hepatica Uher 2000/2452]|jgi:dihydroneopterin aldolase|uniref:7,8-dihydroneopterin aldolase n=1 Tax=Drouetiella hepatica Uher 2000/2452 TaxID=904376 RepID=A0A951QGD3_9CYAN|nr:dihydroneopterin aldolase [Drouetiella hepatica Uher 2000/2452]
MKDIGSLDTIQLTGIRAYGYTGLFPEEQSLGQWFEVDLTLWVDITEPGKSDRIEDTYDYRADVKSIQELVRTARFRLIEKLVETIAQTVLASGSVKQVRVRLTKVNPPIPDFSGKVSVEITRVFQDTSFTMGVQSDQH